MRYIILSIVIIFKVYDISAQQTVGMFLKTPGSMDGYVLFSPINSTNTYLIDKCGYSIHTWTSTHRPGQSVYFLSDGTLLRPGNMGNTVFNAGGNGGVVEQFSWNSTLLWSYTISSAVECQHHDVKKLPNGNILAIVWELKTVSEATLAGRNPSLLGSSLWSEKIVELQPVGSSSANIVWEWQVWDHLIQEYDSTKSNYGIVSQHPELLNLNYYTGSATAIDWLHINSIDYNAALDQIIVSSHSFNEVWIIDHSTSILEASTHSGGLSGRGGDLLYRWGNPIAYNRGTNVNRILYGQHNAHWIEPGLSGEGDMMIFNNGIGRPGGNYSSVEIIHPPIDSLGNYNLQTNQSYAPDSAYWVYKAVNPADFYGQNISGAQRLSNGNTIICIGPKGDFFEIDSMKNTVWHYINPIMQSGIATQGTTPTMNSVFRCSLYEPSYPGFNGFTLLAGSPIELNPLPSNCDMLNEINSEAITSDLSITASNPFSENLWIRFQENLPKTTISLMDITGRTIHEWNEVNYVKGLNNNLDVSTSIPVGMFFLKINTKSFCKILKLVHQ